MEVETFEAYIKNHVDDFNGNFYYKDLREIDSNYKFSDFQKLKKWYKTPENKDKAERILKKHKVNVQNNLKKAIKDFEDQKANFTPKSPTKHSFEYLGMVHEH